LQAEFDVELDWRGFELHPEIPAGGMPLDAMFGAERVARIRPYLLDFARAQGVTGIPTFDVGTERVVGAQPYPVLAEAVVRQGGRPRAPVSGPRRS